jgi:hypothetical protein
MHSTAKGRSQEALPPWTNNVIARSPVKRAGARSLSGSQAIISCAVSPRSRPSAPARSAKGQPQPRLKTFGQQFVCSVYSHYITGAQWCADPTGPFAADQKNYLSIVLLVNGMPALPTGSGCGLMICGPARSLPLHRLAHHPSAHRVHRELDAVPQMQLVQNVSQVILDRAFREHQRLGDLPVGPTLHHQP